MVRNSSGGFMKCQYALILLILFSCSKTPDKVIKANGQFSAYSTVLIKSEIEGRLTSIHFEDGQQVEKGDVLFSIDPKPHEIALELATAARAHNISKLQYAAEKVDRYKTLLENKYVSEIDYIHYKSELTSFEALVMQNEAEIRKAKFDLENCTIYSPITGKASRHHVDEGNILQKNDSLIVITQIDPIYFDFSLTKNQYKSLSPTSEITLTETGEKGVISFIENQGDLIFLRVTFQNPNHKMVLGSFSSVSIRL